MDFAVDDNEEYKVEGIWDYYLLLSGVASALTLPLLPGSGVRKEKLPGPREARRVMRYLAKWEKI